MTYKRRNRNTNATQAFEPATVLVREKVDVNAADIKTAEYLGTRILVSANRINALVR